MDKNLFTNKKTGSLVQITNPEIDWAFVPDPLPPNWDFPLRLWPLLTKAKEELARLDGIGRTLPNPELLLQPLQSREAIRSSSLEGTYTEPHELLLFELNPREPTSEQDRANDWLEVSNYSRALRQGMTLLNEIPLSLRFIREIHKTLLTGVRGKERMPGNFRDYQVHIGHDRRFVPPPPNSLMECLDAFERHLNSEDDQFDPLVRCYILHYQFEASHRLGDGNGRVGRVLLALMIFHWCRLSLPWLYMSAFFERYKDEYIGKLFEVSTEGNWEAWIEFCLEGTVLQAKDAIIRCDNLMTLKEDFHKRVSERSSPRTHPMIENLFTVPVFTIPILTGQHSVTYPTAKSDVDRLVEAGIIAPLPKSTRPRTYYSPEIIQIAYRETHST